MAFSLKSAGLKQPELLDALVANAQPGAAFGADGNIPAALSEMLIRVQAAALSTGHLLFIVDASGEIVQMLICESPNFFSLILINDAAPLAPVQAKFSNTALKVFTASECFLGQVPDLLFPKTKPALFRAPVPLVPVSAPATVPPATTHNYTRTDPEKECDRNAIIVLALQQRAIWEGRLVIAGKNDVNSDDIKYAMDLPPKGAWSGLDLPYIEHAAKVRAALIGCHDSSQSAKADKSFDVLDVFPTGVAPRDNHGLTGSVTDFGDWFDLVLDTGHFYRELFRSVMDNLITKSNRRNASVPWRVLRFGEFLTALGLFVRAPASLALPIGDLKDALRALACCPKILSDAYSTYVTDLIQARDSAQQDAPAGKKPRVDNSPAGKLNPPVLPTIACFAWCASEAKLDGVRSCQYTPCSWSHGPFTTFSTSQTLSSDWKALIAKRFPDSKKLAVQTKKLRAWMVTAGFAK